MTFEEFVEGHKRWIETDGIVLYKALGRHSFHTAKGRVAFFYQATRVHCFPAIIDEKALYNELRIFREKLKLPLLSPP